MRAIDAWCGALAIGATALAAPSAYPTPVAGAASSEHAAAQTVSAQDSPVRLLLPRGIVTTAMPAAAISRTDGLPAVLVDGRSYRLTVHVGVAGGQPATPARVLLVGADRAVCVTDRLPAGAVSTLRCTFVPTHLGERGLRIEVLVGSAQSSQVVAPFDHCVVRTTSPE